MPKFSNVYQVCHFQTICICTSLWFIHAAHFEIHLHVKNQTTRCKNRYFQKLFSYFSSKRSIWVLKKAEFYADSKSKIEKSASIKSYLKKQTKKFIENNFFVKRFF